MEGTLPQLLLVAALVLANAAFAVSTARADGALTASCTPSA